MAATSVRIKRVYESPACDDGFRALVDRLWPRGLRRDALRLDRWVKDVAPSPALRRWFAHDPAKFAEFTRRYRRELDERLPIVDELLAAGAEAGTLTLLTASSDEVHNHAVVLETYLGERLASA